MTRSAAAATVFGVLALAIAGGCVESETPEMSDPATLETPATVPTDPGTTTTPEGAAALTVGESPTHGSFVADAAGRALYLLESDSASVSTCYDECAEVWPPFIAPEGAAAVAAPNLQENLLGTLTREDGATQVTYGGHPLYYYVEDLGAPEPMGQDLTDEWGEWYLVTPTGEPLEER